MNLLAISGSTRIESTNSKLLRAIQRCTISDIQVELYQGIGELPIFNQDLEGASTPSKVLEFCEAIDQADGILLACPEYARSIPGGIKNAIDWLVSREEIIRKPIALVHASYRGDDMLSSLRYVLETVTERFAGEIFLRIPLNSSTAIAESTILENEQNTKQIAEFLSRFQNFIVSGSVSRS